MGWRAAGLILGGGYLGALTIRSTGPAVSTHAVQMTSSRFEPEVIGVRPGDTVRFSNIRGGPHNIEFFPDSIPRDAQRLLAAAMPGDKIGPLSSPLLILDDAMYEFVVPALAPGRYAFVCRPHFAAGMTGAMVVADTAS